LRQAVCGRVRTVQSQQRIVLSSTWHEHIGTLRFHSITRRFAILLDDNLGGVARLTRKARGKAGQQFQTRRRIEQRSSTLVGCRLRRRRRARRRLGCGRQRRRVVDWFTPAEPAGQHTVTVESTFVRFQWFTRFTEYKCC